jgi:hypothetical protein
MRLILTLDARACGNRTRRTNEREHVVQAWWRPQRLRRQRAEDVLARDVRARGCDLLREPRATHVRVRADAVRRRARRVRHVVHAARGIVYGCVPRGVSRNRHSGRGVRRCVCVCGSAGVHSHTEHGLLGDLHAVFCVRSEQDERA